MLCYAGTRLRSSVHNILNYHIVTRSGIRQLRTTVPVTIQQLQPQWEYHHKFELDGKAFKESQKRNFDLRPWLEKLLILSDRTYTWIISDRGMQKETIVSQESTARSYNVSSPKGKVRRHRSHIKPVQKTEGSENKEDQVSEPPSRRLTRMQTGTLITLPID